MQKNRSSISNNTLKTRRKIDKTTYEVALHFSTTSTEGAYDKLKRIILSDNNKFNPEDEV